MTDKNSAKGSDADNFVATKFRSCEVWLVILTWHVNPFIVPDSL